MAHLRADAESYAAHLVTGSLGTLSLQVGFRLLRGQMIVPARWLGMPERQGVSFPAVRFVAGNHALSRELGRLRYRLQTTLEKLAVPVTGTSLLYVLPVWKQAEIERALQAFQLRTMGDLESQFKSEHLALQEDFLARFAVAFAEFTNAKYPDAWPLTKVLPLADEAFNTYVVSDPFGVVAQYSVPLPNASDPYDPLFQAAGAGAPAPTASGVRVRRELSGTPSRWNPATCLTSQFKRVYRELEPASRHGVRQTRRSGTKRRSVHQPARSSRWRNPYLHHHHGASPTAES